MGASVQRPGWEPVRCPFLLPRPLQRPLSRTRLSPYDGPGPASPKAEPTLRAPRLPRAKLPSPAIGARALAPRRARFGGEGPSVAPGAPPRMRSVETSRRCLGRSKPCRGTHNGINHRPAHPLHADQGPQGGFPTRSQKPQNEAGPSFATIPNRSPALVSRNII